MEQGMVSAIITTYKRPAEIVVRAAKSILAQTYKNTELIIVDDSPPGYEQRSFVEKGVKELSGEIKYIQHETNKGACAARNTGIDASNGEFIAFLDDDDEWLPQKLEKQMKKFADPDVGLVYCSNYNIDNIKGTKREWKRQFHTGSVYKKLIYGNFIGSTSFPVMRKELVIKAGKFDVEMRSEQDFDLWLRMSRITRFECVDEPLVNYYIHDGETITGNPKNKIAGLTRLKDKNMDYLRHHRAAYRKRMMDISYMYAVDKQYVKSLGAWLHGSVLGPRYLKSNIYYLKKHCRIMMNKTENKRSLLQ